MSTALAILDDVQPLAVLTDDAQYSEFYKKIKAEIAAFVPDLSTDKSRGEIKSLAYKVTRTKTAIDEAGKKLNEDGRAKINAVDAQRRKIRDEFDALAIEVRKPLTDWEEAEKRREETVREYFDAMTAIVVVGSATTAAALEERVALLASDGILGVGEGRSAANDEMVFRERLDEARAAMKGARTQLEAAIANARQREADAAELARLRKAEQDRLAEETARIGRELVEKRGREEAARLAKLAEARKEIEAEEAKDREAEIARAATAAAEEKYKREIEAAQAEARAVAERAERAEKERLAEIEKTRVEEEQRATNRKHRTRLIRETEAAIVRFGVSAEIATKLVVMIIDGEIPNVTMRF